MKRLLFVGAMAMGFVSPASAVTFQGNYTPNVNTNPNIGVELSTSGVEALDFDLFDIDQSVNIDLFDIHLKEAIGLDGFFNRNDLQKTDISVDFTFTSPSDSEGTVTGTTQGKFVSLFNNDLAVVWDSALSFDFDGAVLELVLADLIIDESFFFFSPTGSGTIQGAFTLLTGGGSSNAPSAVPVPMALPLFGTGLALMGFLSWRKKRDLKSI